MFTDLITPTSNISSGCRVAQGYHKKKRERGRVTPLGGENFPLCNFLFPAEGKVFLETDKSCAWTLIKYQFPVKQPCRCMHVWVCASESVWVCRVWHVCLWSPRGAEERRAERPEQSSFSWPDTQFCSYSQCERDEERVSEGHLR